MEGRLRYLAPTQIEMFGCVRGDVDEGGRVFRRPLKGAEGGRGNRLGDGGRE